MAQQIKEGGNVLMVIAVIAKMVNKVIDVLQLASDGFTFRTDIDVNMSDQVEAALCKGRISATVQAALWAVAFVSRTCL